jgi:uncharacterized protein
VILKPKRLEMLTEGPTDAERETVGKHFQYYTRLTGAGQAFLVGRTQNADEHTIGLAIIHARDQEHADLVAARDPAVSEGVMSAQVLPYKIALMGEA